MEQARTQKGPTTIYWARAGQVAAVVIAAPFLIGAVALWLGLRDLPVTASHLAKARVLGAALLASGIGLGIIGAVFTLSARTPHRRILCTALTLFAFSHVLFGFYVRYAIEATSSNRQPPLFPLVTTLALWACSALLALRAPRIAAEQAAKGPEEETKEEQPPLQSRP